MNPTHRYVAASSLPVPVQEAFAYHSRRGALERLTPPWENVSFERNDSSLEVGSRVIMKVSVGGVPIRWVAEHTGYDPPSSFTDTQVSGPFESWVHTHRFQSQGDTTLLRDEVEYQTPGGKLGELFGESTVRKKLESMFAYRHRLTHDDLMLAAHYPGQPLRIAISGSSGLVGRQLTSMLTLLGHHVQPIVRSPEGEDSIAVWDRKDEVQKLEGVDVVIHLAGKPIADQRWNKETKQQIRDSRVVKTQELCEAIAGLQRKPSVLICASATGIYGNRGDEVLKETSALGDDFLADVARQWEDACQPARDAGVRVVNARFGLILSPQGGALAKMLLPAKFASGSLGDGKQWWSWIAIDDVLGAIYHAIRTPAVRGPVNFVSPEPMTNADFVKVLGRVLGRPALVPAPAFALRAALGEMADALLLASARVEPTGLMQTQYRYRFTDLQDALEYLLGKHRLASVE